METRIDTEALLERLLTAQSEEAVTEIIADDPVLADMQNWRPYGGPEYAGIFFNQQGNPIAALADKLINCVDARLTRECLSRGIDPESPSAPRTMMDAVEAFFGVRAGDFSEVTERRRRELAKGIVLAADGTPQEPNMIIIDEGEGQHRNDFEKTFLSLVAGNKQRIPFVQGQFNMGGTGVLRYAGSKGYELIVSRRAPELLSGREDTWGFTLIRHHPARAGEKSSYWEYCVGRDGMILAVPGWTPQVLPQGSQRCGTIIKLWAYQLPASVKTNITLDLWRELNRQLWAPALPILLWEKREYRGHSPTKLLLGNKVRIQVDDRQWLEEGFPLTVHAVLGPMGMRPVEVSVFRMGYRKSDYASPDEAILFTVNGQAQAALGRTFLKSPNRANLGYLADYMIVHVDCSDVPIPVRERIFPASRDRMYEGPERKEIEDALADELRHNNELRRLDERRRLQGLADKASDDRLMDVINRLLQENRGLLNYLKEGGHLVTPEEPGEVPIARFRGRYIPTFLRVQGQKGAEQEWTKQIAANSFARLHLETDAQDDYLDRQTDQGELKVSPDLVRAFNLFSGRLTLKIVPPTDAQEGDRIPLTVELTRPEESPLSAKVVIEIVSPASPQRGGGSGDKPKPRGRELGAPKPWLVYREQRDGFKTWAEMDPQWNANNICDVKGDALDVYINMDAAILTTFLRRHRRLPGGFQDEIREAWKLGIYLCSLALYRDLAKYEQEEVFADAIGAVAKVLLEAFYGQDLLKAGGAAP